MKALLLCGGPIAHYEALSTFTVGFDFVIAVDSGYRHAKPLGLVPQVLIGDLDSLSPELIREAEALGVEKVTFSADKDLTDTHLAIQYCLDHGIMQLRLLGALGKRMDHTLSNLSLLQWIDSRGGSAELVDAHNRITYLKDSMEIIGEEGQVLSIIPISPLEGLDIEGVRYPLVAQSVPYASSLCVSNRITVPKAFVRLTKGEAFVIIAKD